MINKKDLKQIENIRKEIKYFERKLEKLESKPIKIVKDSVQASSTQFPYTRHTAKIEGFENPINIKKYKKIIKSRKYELEKSLNHLEYELKNIEDSELRMIIRYKYTDNLNYIQIAHKMNDNDKKIYTEEGIRKKLERFFKKI